jgi:hypothetical protein
VARLLSSGRKRKNIQWVFVKIPASKWKVLKKFLIPSNQMKTCRTWKLSSNHLTKV